jgi:hypothetical protein
MSKLQPECYFQLVSASWKIVTNMEFHVGNAQNANGKLLHVNHHHVSKWLLISDHLNGFQSDQRTLLCWKILLAMSKPHQNITSGLVSIILKNGSFLEALETHSISIPSSVQSCNQAYIPPRMIQHSPYTVSKRSIYSPMALQA